MASGPHSLQDHRVVREADPSLCEGGKDMWRKEEGGIENVGKALREKEEEEDGCGGGGGGGGSGGDSTNLVGHVRVIAHVYSYGYFV